jgi:tetratricopeptide (TPR) repeat protein
VELGDALERVGQLPEAMEAYRAAIRVAPRAPEAYEHLARLYASRGDCKQAVPQFQKALEVAPKREGARIELASCQVRLGRATEAVALYQQALKGDPTHVEVYYLIARAVSDSQGLKAAVPWYEKAVAKEPSNPMPHLYLGYWHKERGQKSAAVQEFRKYLSMRPDADDKKDVEQEIEDLGGK